MVRIGDTLSVIRDVTISKFQKSLKGVGSEVALPTDARLAIRKRG